MGHLPARFGLLVLGERGTGLLPGMTRRDRRTPGILALPLRLFDPAIGDLRLLPKAFHAIPTQAQDPTRLVIRFPEKCCPLWRPPS